jgi:uncharacterized MAPEG superfamily protein
MSLELNCLGWASVLGIVHIIIASNARTKEFGVRWNMGARDDKQPPLSPFTDRLFRAQSNFFETFPLFASAVLIATISQNYSVFSRWGALIYLFARVIYFPLYAFGIPVIRTLVWLISMLGLFLVLVPSLF